MKMSNLHKWRILNYLENKNNRRNGKNHAKEGYNQMAHKTEDTINLWKKPICDFCSDGLFISMLRTISADQYAVLAYQL